MEIPEGWRKTTLGDLVSHTKGYAFSSEDYCSSGTRIIRISDTTEFSIKDDNPIFFPKSKLSGLEKYLLSSNDIIINTVGSRPHLRASMVGKVIRIPEQNSGSLLNQNMVKIKSSPDVNEEFLYCTIANDRFLDFISRIVRGNANQVSITLKDLFLFSISLPPLPEQKKIAEILSTWDRAIETVSSLIANSQAQKKALMQQLLTGKKRLPGFDGEWETKQLSDAADILISNVDKKSSVNEVQVKLCNYMDVYRRDTIQADQAFMIATASKAQLQKFSLKVDDVIITKDSEKPDDIAVPSVVVSMENDLVCGYHLAIIRPNKYTSGRFLKYYFEAPKTQHYFACRANGATRFGLTISSIKDAPISVPPLEEQKAIAGALTSAEVNITSLFGSLKLLKSEKSALMQQLLTGKRRVKINEESVG